MRKTFQEKLSCIPGIYEEKPVIFIYFDFDENILSEVKQLPGTRQINQL